jgi:hypothetical protein
VSNYDPWNIWNYLNDAKIYKNIILILVTTILCIFHTFSAFFLYFLFLCFVMFMYLYRTYVYVLYCTVDVHTLLFYCENLYDVLCCFREMYCFVFEYMIFVNTATELKPNCS